MDADTENTGHLLASKEKALARGTRANSREKAPNQGGSMKVLLYQIGNICQSLYSGQLGGSYGSSFRNPHLGGFPLFSRYRNSLDERPRHQRFRQKTFEVCSKNLPEELLILG